MWDEVEKPWKIAFMQGWEAFKNGSILVQLTLQSYFEIKACNGNINNIVELFSQDSPEAVEIAKIFYKEKYLDYCVQRDIAFKDVFDSIILRL